MIESADILAAKKVPDLAASRDLDFFLDTRRVHRLRPDEPGVVVAIRRDGARHRFEQPHDICEHAHEAFAAEIFQIGERFAKAAAGSAKPRRFARFLKVFARRQRA